jgi:hypothetical protein
MAAGWIESEADEIRMDGACTGLDT